MTEIPLANKANGIFILSRAIIFYDDVAFPNIDAERQDIPMRTCPSFYQYLRPSNDLNRIPHNELHLFILEEEKFSEEEHDIITTHKELYAKSIEEIEDYVRKFFPGRIIWIHETDRVIQAIA